MKKILILIGSVLTILLSARVNNIVDIGKAGSVDSSTFKELSAA